MIEHTPFTPDWVSPPGDTIEDALDELGMTQVAFAQRIGFSKKHVNDLIKGKKAITAEAAIKLEAVLGEPASFWLNREAQYREALARRAALDQAALKKDWLKEIPLRWMIKTGWVSEFSHKGQQVLTALSFFGVASIEAWRSQNETLSPAFRTSPAYQKHHGSVAAWLRKAELEAQAQRLRSFDKTRLRALLPDFRKLTLECDPKVFIPRLRELCNPVGVAVVFIPAPPGCPASGATWFVAQDRAVIALTLRHKTDDHLWFSFFHEVGHLLKHSKKIRFVEGLDGLSPEKEQEADVFAQRTLIPHEKTYQLLGNRGHLSRATIVDFAASEGIAPGIVVGRLQHDARLPHTHLNNLKMRFEWVGAIKESSQK